MRRGVGIPQPAPAARYKNKNPGFFATFLFLILWVRLQAGPRAIQGRYWRGSSARGRFRSDTKGAGIRAATKGKTRAMPKGRGPDVAPRGFKSKPRGSASIDPALLLGQSFRTVLRTGDARWPQAVSQGARRDITKKRGHPAPNALAMFSNDGAPYFKTQVPSGDQIPHLCA